MKDMERIFFEPTQKKAKKSTTKPETNVDPYEILKTYNLELIKGIGPKTKLKLEEFGIKTPYDLIHTNAIKGFSIARLDAWKENALLLQ